MAPKKSNPASASRSPRARLPCGRPLTAAPEVTGEGARTLLANLLKRLDEYVAAQGLNRSDARRKIIETIVREGRHFRALDLLAWLSERFPEVGKATLYRTLPVLVASGVLQEGPTDSEGQVLYELADGDHHDHLVCLDCRQIFEFHDDAIEARQDAVAARMGFRTRSHRHVVYAHCDYREKSGA